jgi:hypothetical protein
MQIAREIQFTTQAISMVRTPGQIAYGKLMLEHSRDVMEDIGQSHVFRGILESAGIDSDLDQIDLSDDYPDQYPHRPPGAEPPAEWDNFMRGTESGSISQFMLDELIGGISMMGPSTLDPGQLTAEPGPSTSNPPRIRTQPNRYTPGTDALGHRRRQRR